MNNDPFCSMIAGLKAEGLTATQISRESGLSRQSLYRFENRESRAPTLESFNRLALCCKRYGLPVPQPSNRR